MTEFDDMDPALVALGSLDGAEREEALRRVDADPAFAHPTKPIGSFLTEARARELGVADRVVFAGLVPLFDALLRQDEMHRPLRLAQAAGKLTREFPAHDRVDPHGGNETVVGMGWPPSESGRHLAPSRVVHQVSGPWRHDHRHFLAARPHQTVGACTDHRASHLVEIGRAHV